MKGLYLYFTTSFLFKDACTSISRWLLLPRNKRLSSEGFVCSGHLPIRRYRTTSGLCRILYQVLEFISCVAPDRLLAFFLDRFGYLGEPSGWNIGSPPLKVTLANSSANYFSTISSAFTFFPLLISHDSGLWQPGHLFGHPPHRWRSGIPDRLRWYLR